MLDEPHGEVSCAAADDARWLGERDARGAEHRPPVGLSERGQPLDLFDRVQRHARQRRLSVEHELGAPERVGQPAIHLGPKRLAKRLDGPVLDPQPGGRRMAAAGHQMLPAGVQCGMHVEPRHAAHAARRGARAERILGDHHDRPVPALREAAGDDPDHARLPAAVGEHERGVGVRLEPLDRLLRGRERDAPLGRLALGIELVQEVRQRDGAARVGGRQQFDATRRMAHAAGGVESRGEPERDVLTLQARAVGEAGEFDESRQSGTAPLPQAVEAVSHEEPILAEQRHDVGDRAEGCQPDRAQQHLAKPRGHLSSAARPRRDRPRQLECHAGTAQFAEGRRSARQPRVHEHVCGGQLVAEGVMVGDDEFQPQLAGTVGLGDAGDATVHRDDEIGAIGAQPLERGGVEPVALLQTIRHVPTRRVRGVVRKRVEAAHEDGRRAHPVGIVVAVHHHPPAGTDRGEDPIGSVGDARQRLGVVEIAQRAREEAPHVLGIVDAAGDQQRGDERRHACPALECRDDGTVVGTDVPALGHDGLPSWPG